MILCLMSCGLLFTFPRWQTITTDDGSDHEVKPFPSRVVVQVLTLIVGLATLFSFVSMFWIHVGAVTAAGTLDFVFQGLVSTYVGWITMLIGWLGFSFATIALMGLLVTWQSIILLDSLTDDI